MKTAISITVLLLALISICKCIAQPNRSILENKTRVGFNYGMGNVQGFPFRSDSYIYDSRFYKIQYNRTLWKRSNWVYALNIEPALYLSNHGEMITLSIDPKVNTIQNTPNYEAVSIQEWVLNIGFQIQYRLAQQFNIYMLGSLGPTYNNRATKRLNKGFAFSDIIAFGLNCQFFSTLLDFRFSLRHVSNAGFNFPNKGYNSSAFEVGFSVPLDN